MIYVFFSGTTSETGRALVEALQAAGLENVSGGSRSPEGRPDVLIRWGNSAGVRQRPRRVLNKKAPVELATDKLQALRAMWDRNVPVPPTWTAAEARLAALPVLGRRTNHTQGRDVVLCLNPRDIQEAVRGGCSHFTALIPKHAEFRVHCFRGEIIKVSEKVLTNPENYDPVVWNFDAGFTFRNPRDVSAALVGELQRVGLLAVQTMGLDFGAADLVVGPGSQVSCLEVNTGPSLAENSIDAYVTSIVNYVRGDNATANTE